MITKNLFDIELDFERGNFAGYNGGAITQRAKPLFSRVCGKGKPCRGDLRTHEAQKTT